MNLMRIVKQIVNNKSIVYTILLIHNDAVPRVPFHKHQGLPTLNIPKLKGFPSLWAPDDGLILCYLHHGNFCHLVDIADKKAMTVRLRGGEEITAPGIMPDMSTTRDLNVLNPIKLGSDHMMTSYLPNIMQAI